MRQLFLALFAMFGLATSVAACPDYNQYGDTYQATGYQLRTPRLFNVTAGGDSYIWNCPNVRPRTDRGAGYFPTPPDFSFDLSGMGGYQLVISVRSNCDAALLINTGSANWYYDDDDNGNQDPRIVLTRPSNGWLDVWIGTYDGNYCDAQLRMETFPR
ncbi:MAG: hypothetical protein GC146_05510 [Limimaricola sp.]|uniref:hypothetical protein n=1 Tax=Limimaricola sp. TaxID=2211665 RepID=UPI001E154DAA|nr:hypothetical protein [Limimaricola sp.]MBI1416664.1 hypothetical protein [Limimaricola sp.]